MTIGIIYRPPSVLGSNSGCIQLGQGLKEENYLTNVIGDRF